MTAKQLLKGKESTWQCYMPNPPDRKEPGSTEHHGHINAI